MFVGNSDQSRRKKINRKKILCFCFSELHTHRNLVIATTAAAGLCVWPRTSFEAAPPSSIDGLRKMNKESGNELLIKLSNSKEGKDRTLFYYYHPDRVILKNNFWNVFYSIRVLQSNIWNIRLTLEQQTEGARKSFEQR